jgi:hypothetical protein
VGVSFRGNWARQSSSSFGGGLANSFSNPTLVNVAFQGNRADVGGGGVYSFESAPALVNASISGNVAPRGGGMYNRESHALIYNSILWASRAVSESHQIYNDGSAPAIANSLLEGSGGSGAGWDTEMGIDLGGNLDVDPGFVGPIDPDSAPTTAGDLHLLTGSPASDAGDENLIPPGVTADLDGAPRIIFGVVDMGAYEVQPAVRIHLPVIARDSAMGHARQ